MTQIYIFNTWHTSGALSQCQMREGGNEQGMRSSRQCKSLYLVQILDAVSWWFRGSSEAWLPRKPFLLLGFSPYIQEAFPPGNACLTNKEPPRSFTMKSVLTKNSFPLHHKRHTGNPKEHPYRTLESHGVPQFDFQKWRHQEPHGAEQLISQVLKAPPTKLQHSGFWLWHLILCRQIYADIEYATLYFHMSGKVQP